MKLAVVCSRIPYPLEKGDKLRLFHQLKQLSQYHEIHLFALYEKDAERERSGAVLAGICESVHFFKFPYTARILGLPSALFMELPFSVKYFYSALIGPRLKSKIIELNPDLIYCQLVRMAPYLKGLPYVKTIDYMDAFSLGFKRRSRLSPFWQRPLLNLEARLLRNYEKRVYNEFDSHTIISEQDRDHLAILSRENIAVIENGVDHSFFYPDANHQKTHHLVFCGNMGYDPNVKAAVTIGKWAPFLREQFPELRILIAGARPHKLVKNLHGKNGIEVSGWMDDIRLAYWSSEINIAPIFSGSGLQNKILEAMACGLPCITTGVVANSIRGLSGRDLLVARDEDQFVNYIVELLRNKALRKQLSENGLNLVRNEYRWEVFASKLNKILNRTAGN